jgi:hypothetical protein
MPYVGPLVKWKVSSFKFQWNGTKYSECEYKNDIFNVKILYFTAIYIINKHCMVNIYMHYYYFWASAYFSYGRQTPINQSINQSINHHIELSS